MISVVPYKQLNYAADKIVNAAHTAITDNNYLTIE